MVCDQCGEKFEIHSLGRRLWGHFCHTSNKWFYSDGIAVTEDIHDVFDHHPRIA